jgi:hypothetical protein
MHYPYHGVDRSLNFIFIAEIILVNYSPIGGSKNKRYNIRSIIKVIS